MSIYRAPNRKYGELCLYAWAALSKKIALANLLYNEAARFEQKSALGTFFHTADSLHLPQVFLANLLHSEKNVDQFLK